mmetsp:Transcript_150147/g.279980  ORF Transcript_150147/g.279980 Transcript_150147/m.279980 type:complete len:938 (+) Transcript_150147:213-3026(+)
MLVDDDAAVVVPTTPPPGPGGRRSKDGGAKKGGGGKVSFTEATEKGGSGQAQLAWKSHEDKGGDPPQVKVSSLAAPTGSSQGFSGSSGSIRPSAFQHDGAHGEKKRGMAPRKSQVRHLVQSTSFYHSKVAVRMRHVLHGKHWGFAMALLLLLALFLPDIWVLAGVNENVSIDSILMIVMIVFAIELIALSAVDATYFLSFFFFMDIVGTFTMAFDISFLMGRDHKKVQTEGQGDDHNLMLLRATRAARVGARAGRLSRVLRILRFLPFLRSQHGADPLQGGMAGAISGQLSNLLATRVACLTILLVVVIPLFDVLTFPQSDYSLRTWVERISRILSDTTRSADEQALALKSEVAAMIEFFSKYSYGPYWACQGARIGSDGFDCVSQIPGNWKNSRPPRDASTLRVMTDNLRVDFNMHQTIQMDAVFAILTICFIMVIMIFSGLALSSVVTDLAVRPLERMLATVKAIATTVFKFSAEFENDEEQEEETYDVDSSSEMKLLEKVVQKLAIIADLQSGEAQQATAEMEEEDIGILNMMQGKNVIEEKIKQDRRSMAVCRKKNLAPVIKLEDLGMSQEVYQSWSFNTLTTSKAQRSNLAVFTISRFHEPLEGFVSTEDELLRVQKFIQACEKEYLPNPFHNFAHAADVLHAVARMMRIMMSEAFLVELEQFALLIGAAAHDLGHPGVNNGFLAEVGHELALQYNDRSPLENMHCAKLYGIVNQPETNVFMGLSKEQYKEMRKFCVETILHTDMMGHQAMVKELQMLYQMNSEIFIQSAGTNSVAVVEIFNQAVTKTLVMNNLLHSADVSNPCRTWKVCEAWAHCVLEEFFAQGDQEKMLGIPVQFLNDRDKLNRPNSQIGFLEFMIAPFFQAQIKLWPHLADMGTNLQGNLKNWEEMWVKETSPMKEEREKVHTRVQRVVDNLEEAKKSLVQEPQPDGPS